MTVEERIEAKKMWPEINDINQVTRYAAYKILNSSSVGIHSSPSGQIEAASNIIKLIVCEFIYEQFEERAHLSTKLAAFDWLAGCTAGQWEEINDARLSRSIGSLLVIVEEQMEKEKQTNDNTTNITNV